MTKLSMPQASYKKMILAITTYYEFGRSATLDDIAKKSNSSRSGIGRVNSFLSDINVVKGDNNYKQLTSPWGYELAKALKLGIEKDIAHWWEEVIKKSEFLSSIILKISNDNNLSKSDLKKIILSQADISALNADDKETGANAIIEILRKSGIINFEDGICKIIKPQVLKHIKPHSNSSASIDLPVGADNPPDFSKLTKDENLAAILYNRWSECARSVSNKTPLTAIIMIGALLEGLLMTKLTEYPDQEKVYRAKSVPIDNKSGQKRDQKVWTLTNYIEIAHELELIGETSKKLGALFGEYRNLIHPRQERSQNIKIQPGDEHLFWLLLDSIARQLTK